MRVLVVAAILALVPGIGSASAGGWKYEEKVDPLNDEKIIYVSTESVLPLADRPQERAVLTFVCSQEQTSAHFWFGDRHYRITILDYRIDKQPPQKFFSQAAETYGLWGPNAMEFIRPLLTAKELYARTDTLLDYSVDARFMLDGLDEAIAPIKAACKWE